MVKLYLFFLSILIHSCFSSECKAQIVINEIMANPNNGSLPMYEYIELFNNSSLPIELSEITLGINNNYTPFPAYILSPKQYIILCNQEASQSFERYGNVLPIQRWETLTNTGATITLYQGSEIIDKISYKNNWHNSTIKTNGGWSLERINPNWPCGTRNNWSSSFSPNGGTPGRQNSVLDKKSKPEIKITNSKIDNQVLKISFNIEQAFINQLSTKDFSVDKNIGSPNQIEWNTTLDTLALYFTKNFLEDNLYTLQIKPIEICSYKIEIPNESLFKQSNIASQSVIISEILFNPKDGGADFVEIFNTTEYPINIKGWQLGNRPITADLMLLEPKQYLVITTNKSSIALHYPSAVTDHILQTVALPAYPNQQGNVVLFSTKGNRIDSIYYNATMHDPLLINVKGVSLERQSMNINNIYFNKWTSSSNLHENATPGYQNSTNSENKLKKNKLFLSSKTVSPNNDFHEDLLEIIYYFNSSEFYLNVNIYNDKGSLINRLIRNQRAGSEGKITWNIENENGQKVPSGHYIMIAELHNTKGTKERFKKAFVIVPNRLNY